MPTGYTAAVVEGISFRDFVMRCARAMGACIMMRDDPHDAPIPVRFEPSDYHTKELKRVEKELAELKSLSDSQASAKARSEAKKESTDAERIIREKNEQRGKYEAMLSQVRAWVPPTPDHASFKQFMIEQLTGSIDFDCDTKYYLDKKQLVLSGPEWKAGRLKSLLHDLDYHKREHAEEISRTESRNDWIAKLRESLKQSAGEIGREITG